MMEGSGSESAQIMTDPGGLKTYGSYGSGSTTLVCSSVGKKYYSEEYSKRKEV
jgi:hypothetical protein